MKRKDLAKEFSITSICFIPVEGGVLEYGTHRNGAAWGEKMPICPDMPKLEMKRAFEDGATYTMFWKKDGDDFTVMADYVLPERTQALRRERGDDETFCSVSRRVRLPADGGGYIATAASSGKGFVVDNAATDRHLRRQAAAVEFDIGEIHIVPCKDGVLEYGKALWSIGEESFVV